MVRIFCRRTVKVKLNNGICKFLYIGATNGLNFKMKTLLILSIALLTSCGPGSSPEGRSKERDQVIQNQIDSLKSQNKAMADSLALIDKTVKELQHQ